MPWTQIHLFNQIYGLNGCHCMQTYTTFAPLLLHYKGAVYLAGKIGNFNMGAHSYNYSVRYNFKLLCTCWITLNYIQHNAQCTNLLYLTIIHEVECHQQASQTMLQTTALTDAGKRGGGLDYWTGVATGLDHWTTGLDCRTELNILIHSVTSLTLLPTASLLEFVQTSFE